MSGRAAATAIAEASALLNGGTIGLGTTFAEPIGEAWCDVAGLAASGTVAAWIDEIVHATTATGPRSTPRP